MKRKVSSGEQTDAKTKRRKREKKSDSEPEKNGKQSGHVEGKELKSKLDLSNPQSLVKSILSPHTPEQFQEEYWEKKPLHIKRDDDEYYGNLFGLDSLIEILSKNQLHYEVDLNVCKYVDGEKEMMNGEDEAKSSEVKNMIEKQNATVQFHQPQRFSDPLWKMMELLEKFFGNHVGANVYITPSGSQGLAPHNDDIEAFVLQLEGKKKWMLYKPLQELSREYSPDLSPEEIGEPTHQIELEPGDLLYFPRGTVHQAKTVSDSVSTHITLSTYQNNTWGDFLLEGVTAAIENALAKDIEFRRGLPFNYMSLLGTGKFIDEYVADSDEVNENNKENNSVEKSPKKSADNTCEFFKTKIKDLLCRLVDHMDPNTVVDSRSEDFVANRLPPFQKVSGNDIGDRPTAKSSIKITHPEHLRLVVYEDDDDEEFDATAEEESFDEDMIDDDEMDDDEEEEEKKEKQDKPDQEQKGEKSKKSNKESKKNDEKKKSKSPSNEDSAEEDDEEDILQGPHVRLLFSVHNAREAHMIGGITEPNAVKLPLHFGKAISQLLAAPSEFIALQDLHLSDDNDRLELATTLWTEKLICVK